MKVIFYIIIFALIAFTTKAQFTQQRTLSTNTKTFTKQTLEIKGEGYITALLDEIQPNTPITAPHTYYRCVLTKVDYNFNILWTKKIDNFQTATFNLDSNNNLILTGYNFEVNTGIFELNTLSIFVILKINREGNLLVKRTFNLNPVFTGTIYNVSKFDTRLIVTPTNKIILKYYFDVFSNDANKYICYLIKLNNDFNIDFAKYIQDVSNNLQDKKYFLQAANLHVGSDTSFCLASSAKNINLLTVNTNTQVTRQMVTFDTNAVMQKNIYINNPDFYITHLYKTATGLKITGINNLYFTGSNFGLGKSKAAILNYPTNINQTQLCNNYSRIFKKKLNAFFSFKLIDTNFYITEQLSDKPFFGNYLFGFNYNHVYDSATYNSRLRLVKLKPDFTIDYAKRIPIAGFYYPPSLNAQTNSLWTLAENGGIYFYGFNNPEFFKKDDNINFTLIKQIEPGSYYNLIKPENENKFGITFSALKTDGTKANCNITTDFFEHTISTVSFSSLPLFNFIDTTITFVNKNILVVPFNFTTVFDTCLPLQKPKARFFSQNNLGSFTTTLCVNTPVQLLESSFNEPATWHWILPTAVNEALIDSSNYPNLANFVFNSSGVYNIKLVTVNAAGADTATLIFNIIGPPTKPNLGADTIICNGNDVVLTYQPPIGVIHYFTGPSVFSTSQTILVSNAGQYIINASNNCGAISDTINIATVTANFPTAYFSFYNTCNNLQVNFIDSSLLNGNTALTFTYAYKPALAPATAFVNFSSLSNPSFIFPGVCPANCADSFDVQLTVTATNGCQPQNSIIKRIVLKPKPIASFSTSNSCGGLQVSFTNTSTIAVGSIVSFKYFLNNVLIGTNANFNYSFLTYGNYIVKLVVASQFNCLSDTSSLPITVKEKPLITTIGYYNIGCTNANLNVNLTSNASATNTTILNYYWQLNSNAIISNTVAGQSYNLPIGIATISHWVKANNGCQSDTFNQPVNIQSYPKAIFTVQNGCTNNNLVLANNSLGNITMHTWAFTPTNVFLGTTNLFTPTFAYPIAGNFTIKLKVTTSNNCTDSTTQPVIILASPMASFIVEKACLNAPVVINNTSINTPPITYNWQSNALNYIGNSPSFVYNIANSCPLLLTATNVNNCVTTSFQNILLQPPVLNTIPNIDTLITINQPLQLLATGASSYNWLPSAFLNNANSASPIFNANVAGNYLLTINAINNLGCAATKNITIKVNNFNTSLLLPNVFTPNADGLNDVFKINCRGLKSLTQFTIYNRWGNIVYNQNTCNTSMGWDGTFNSLKQPTDTYVYVWAGVNLSNIKVKAHGTITLIR